MTTPDKGARSLAEVRRCGGGPAAAATEEAPWALSAQPADVMASYAFVGTHRHEAEQVPCYCGCVALNHGSLLDCFMKPQGGFEEHASGCGVCRDIAADLKRFLDSGQDAHAARIYVDAQYSKFGKPTDTP